MNSIERLHLSILAKQAKDDRRNFAGTGALVGAGVGGGAGAVGGHLASKTMQAGEGEFWASVMKAMRSDPEVMKRMSGMDRLKVKTMAPIVEKLLTHPKTTAGALGAGALGLAGAGAGALAHHKPTSTVDKLKAKLGL